ncbi:hypothetical protein MY8738_006905 [Beauveria namnaoensis]
MTLATGEAEHIQTHENETEPVTDGEFVAWAQFLGDHLTIVNFWGYVSAFDAFQTYDCELLSRLASDVSWIGSIQVFPLFFIGTLFGRAADAGYLKLAWSIRALLTVLAIFNLTIPSALLYAIMILVWIGVSNIKGLYSFVIFNGIFAAWFLALWPAASASICSDMKTLHS